MPSPSSPAAAKGRLVYRITTLATTLLHELARPPSARSSPSWGLRYVGMGCNKMRNFSSSRPPTHRTVRLLLVGTIGVLLWTARRAGDQGHHHGRVRNEREWRGGAEMRKEHVARLDFRFYNKRSHLSTNLTPFFLSNTQSFPQALSPSVCIVGGFTVVVLALAHWLLALLEQRHVAAGE